MDDEFRDGTQSYDVVYQPGDVDGGNAHDEIDGPQTQGDGLYAVDVGDGESRQTAEEDTRHEDHSTQAWHCILVDFALIGNVVKSFALAEVEHHWYGEPSTNAACDERYDGID